MRLESMVRSTVVGCCVLWTIGQVGVARGGQPEIGFTVPAATAPPSTSGATSLQTPQALQMADPPPRPDALLGPVAPSRSTTARPTSELPWTGLPAPSFTRPAIDPNVTNQARPSLSVYSGSSARSTISQLPRRTPIRPARVLPAQRPVKPFQTIQRDPTVSPYLNLYRDEENNEAAPNYFAFVRPQLEQLEQNRMQQRAIQQLNGQLQSMSSTIATPGYQGSGMPGTGTPARYMDTAQFYGGWRR